MIISRGINIKYLSCSAENKLCVTAKVFYYHHKVWILCQTSIDISPRIFIFVKRFRSNGMSYISLSTFGWKIWSYDIWSVKHTNTNWNTDSPDVGIYLFKTNKYLFTKGRKFCISHNEKFGVKYISQIFWTKIMRKRELSVFCWLKSEIEIKMIQL